MSIKPAFKKMLSALVIFGAISLVNSASSWAAFTSLSTRTVANTGVDFSTFTLSFSFPAPVLRNISNNAVATSMNWSGVVLGSDVWKASDQYLEVNANSSYPSWGVQLYTNNKLAGATPAYSGTGNPAGLVSANGLSTLPMGWRVLDNTTSYASINDPKLRPDNSGWVGFSWHFVKDIQSPAPGIYQVGEDYSTVVGEKGLHFGEGPLDWGATSDHQTFVYFVSNFANATATTYRTSTLTLEMYYQ